MADPIIDDLLDLFPDVVTVEEPAAVDRYGKVTAWGAAREIPARIAGRIVVVRDQAGEEKVSSMQVLLGGAYGVSPRARLTLPARYAPRQPKVIAVRPSTDENGPHHERIYCA